MIRRIWTGLVVCQFCSIIWIMYLQNRDLQSQTISSKARVIVSISTVLSRKYELNSTLHSILSQSLLPSHILINFANDIEYPVDEVISMISSQISTLPAHLRPLVQFQACSPLWRSCAKLLGALRFLASQGSLNKGHAPNEPYIVYADDDTVYPERWLESLMAGSNEKPGCAIGFEHTADSILLPVNTCNLIYICFNNLPS